MSEMTVLVITISMSLIAKLQFHIGHGLHAPHFLKASNVIQKHGEKSLQRSGAAIASQKNEKKHVLFVTDSI